MKAKQKLIEDGYLQKDFFSAEDMLEVRKRLVKMTTGSQSFDDVLYQRMYIALREEIRRI
jgi:hypothetical protein